MLADFPESNGWDLRNADVFEGKTLERVAANSMIFVGNPPYENIAGRRPDTPEPVELLRRALPEGTKIFLCPLNVGDVEYGLRIAPCDNPEDHKRALELLSAFLFLDIDINLARDYYADLRARLFDLKNLYC